MSVHKIILEKLLDFFSENEKTFLVHQAITNEKTPTISFKTDRNITGDVQIISPSYVRIQYAERTEGLFSESFKSMIDAVSFLQDRFVLNDLKSAKFIHRKEF